MGDFSDVSELFDYMLQIILCILNGLDNNIKAEKCLDDVVLISEFMGRSLTFVNLVNQTEIEDKQVQ